MIQFRIKYPYEYKLAKRSEITYYCDNPSDTWKLSFMFLSFCSGLWVWFFAGM